MLTLNVNQKTYEVDVEPDTPLLATFPSDAGYFRKESREKN